MKLLLTSAGIKNPSIHGALLELLGKPIADCHALCIPTAGYGDPLTTPARAWNFVAGLEPRTPMAELVGSPWVCWNAGSVAMAPQVGEVLIETKPPITGEGSAPAVPAQALNRPQPWVGSRRGLRGSRSTLPIAVLGGY